MLYRLSPTTFILLLLAFLSLSACTTAVPTPPPTVQAVVDSGDLLNEISPQEITVLQERDYGSGHLMLYKWSREGAHCLAASYLTPLNGRWQVHDTAYAECESDSTFTAAYTGNSRIESPFGPPRHTVVYGESRQGSAIRIVWADGRVDRVPLSNGAFLEVRDGRWQVERVELLDADNNVIQSEEWPASLTLLPG